MRFRDALWLRRVSPWHVGLVLLILLGATPACTSADPELAALHVELAAEFALPVSSFHVHRDASELTIEFDNYDVAPNEEETCLRVERLLRRKKPLSDPPPRIVVRGAANLVPNREPSTTFPICEMELPPRVR